MARHRKSRRPAALNPPPSKGGARGGILSSLASQLTSRPLRYEQLEDRRLLAVITVDTVDDSVDLNDGKTSLREAVFAANTVPGADEIVFAASVFSGTRTITLLQGELLVTDPLTVTGPAAALTIDGQNLSRIFNYNAGGAFTLRKLTLNHGRTTADNPAGDPFSTIGSGGALRSTSAGRVTLDQVTVINSSTAGANARGGGVFVAGSLAVINSRLAGNRTEGADAEGGSIAVMGPVSIQNSQISRSRASRGGGVAAWSTVEINGTTLDDNTAFDDVLGAGGGLYAAGFSASLLNSTLSGNAAQVTGTDARAYGGGVFASGALSLRYTTITANTASSLGIGALAAGGGVYAAGSLDVYNTIVAGNFSTESDADVHAAAAATVRYSLIGDNQGTALPEAPLGSPDGYGNLIGGLNYGPIDPRLGQLKNNGGPTLTHALLFGSPAIANGDPATALPAGDIPAYDQRGAGFARRIGVRLDIGAVASGFKSWIVDTLIDESDQNYGPGDLSLREALERAAASTGEDIIEFAPALFTTGPGTIALTLGALKPSLGTDVRGPGPLALTIDASGNDQTPTIDDAKGTSVLAYAGGGTEAFLSGMTVTGGDSQTGGGIQTIGAMTTLSDVVVVDNYAQSMGGGIAGGPLTVRASRIINNRSGNVGGGVRSTGLTMERSLVAGNQAALGLNGGGQAGLAIYGSTVIVDSEISNNIARRGIGGIDVEAESGTFVMVNTLVRGNQGTEGGMWINAPFEIYGSSIVENVATNRAGGLFLNSGGTIENSTISGNRAANSGGGIYWNGMIKLQDLVLRHTTITGNISASDHDPPEPGGGIFQRFISNLVGISLSNTIVAGNGQGNLQTLNDISSQSVTAEYSLVGTAAGSNLAEAPLGAPDASGNLIGGPIHGVIDAKLAPLADNGGPILSNGGRLLSHNLLPGSPARDAGDPTLLPDGEETPVFDQRGTPFSRLVGPRIDIGASESIGSPILVDTLADESDGDYSRGDLSLREAIELANTQPGANEIAFDPALFAAGPATILLTHGELKIRDFLSVTGPGAALLTIDASGNDPTPEADNGDGSRAIQIADGQSSSTIDVFIHDVRLAGGDEQYNGGAILSYENLTLDNVEFESNHARVNGGAVSAYLDPLAASADENGGRLSISNSRFSNNLSGTAGGAIYISSRHGGSALLETLDLERNTSQSGGAIFTELFDSSYFLLLGSTISKNTAFADGGGVHLTANEASSAIVSDSLIQNNTANRGFGGGLRMTFMSQSNISVIGCNIISNTSLYSGGFSIACSTGGTAFIAQSLIAGNVAIMRGGGGTIGTNAGSTVVLDQLTVTGNQGDRTGGLLLGIVEYGGSIELRRSTVTNNTARLANSAAGGISTSGNAFISIENSIIAANHASPTSNADLALDFRTQLAVTHSLIGYGNSPALIETVASTPDANGNFIGGQFRGAIDPLLGPLASNGGPTLTHALLTGSPAIDAGDSAVTPGVSGAPEFDQRGAPYSRLVGASIDMGAYESQSPAGALNADFTLDGRVDGSDFLAWQRGVGRTGVVTIRHGDATANGIVDGNDLAVWRARMIAPGDAIQLAAVSAAEVQAGDAGRERQFAGVAQAVSTLAARDAAFEIAMRWPRSRARRR